MFQAGHVPVSRCGVRYILPPARSRAPERERSIALPPDHYRLRDYSYANEVLLDLIQILMGNEVPDADSLMPALVCAFEIILDMMESGDLVPGDDEAAAVLKNPADFNNELCRICRKYAAVDAQIREIPVGPDALTQRKQQIKDEEARLEGQIRDLTTAEQDLTTRRTLAALHRQNLKKPLEEALSKLTGSPVQVRLNGEGMTAPETNGSKETPI